MKHLDEMALEAMASGREDLLSDEARAHVEACEECRALAVSEGEWARDASVALKRSAVKVDGLDAMIARAMAAAPSAQPASRRSLWIGAAAGGVSAAVLAALSLRGAPSVTVLSAIGRQGYTLARAADRMVESFIPGGWIAVAIVGLIVAVMLALPVQLLLGNKRGGGSGLATGAIALLLAILTLAPALSARAYRTEGTWPEGRVTLDVEQLPTSEALRLAAESAGLGVVVRLPNDPPVTLHVREVPLADVVQALIGDANVVVIVTPTLLTVREDTVPAENAVPAAVVAPAANSDEDEDEDEDEEVEEAEAPAAIPTIPENLGDRVTFGGDTHVREGESVRSVFTMGGDARVDGRSFGDVVTMGGDADVRGEVIGNLITMGGDIRVRDGAIVHGDVNAMGGEIDVDDGARVTGQVLTSGEGETTIHMEETAGGDEPGGFFRWALWHALLFLLGLVLLGTARQRVEVLRSDLVERPLRNMFGGGFAMMAGIIIAGVLVLTLIGIPGSAILGTALFLGTCIGWVTAALCLGSVLPIAKLKDRPVVQLAVGLGILFAVGLIPIIGTLIVMAVALAGFGAVVATNLGKMPRGRRNHVPTGPFRDAA